jgi:hypothetical protein
LVFAADVSRADPSEGRGGFARLFDRVEGNRVRVVLVEDANLSRPRRAELGIALLAKRGE